MVLSLAAIALIASGAYAQVDEMDVDAFRKVVASPKINLVLKEGERESVRLEYSYVDRENIKVEVTGKRLHIYLDKAKIAERPMRVHGEPADLSGRRDRWSPSIYRRATVTAYVTYRRLEGVEIRGNGNIFCDNDIKSKNFKIKAYGENEIRIPSLTAGKLKTKFYGVNSLRIAGGEVGHQKHVLYGESRIDTRGLACKTAATNVYGEGRIMLNATEELHLNSFGEPNVIVSGSPVISKGIVVGNARIRKY